MSLSRVFLLLVAFTAGVSALFYYTSDYYAVRSAGASPASEAAPTGGDENATAPNE